MPQLDAISPNPKQPKRKPQVHPRGVPELPPEVAERRRKTMWAIVGGITAVIIIVWFTTLGPRLRSISGDNSAWSALTQKFGEIFSTFGQSGDEAIRNIDINAPTQEDIRTLQESVFPNADAVTGQTNVNTNVNAVTNQNSNTNSAAGGNSNTNTAANQNTNAR